MSMKMYAGMIAFLTVMLSVFLILAWSIIKKVAWHYRNRNRIVDPGDTGLPEWKESGGKLPLYKAVPLAFAIAWIIVHFVIKP